MKKTGLFVALLVLGCVALPHRTPAPIVVREGEGTNYVPPGSEEVPNLKDAQAQFDVAFGKETAGNFGTAIAGYLKTVHRFPKSSIAPNAQYKAATLYEKIGSLANASKQYEKLIKDYPRSSDFNNALDGEYRIATAYLEGTKQKILGVPALSTLNNALRIYNFLITNAPYSRYAPLSQFNIGQVYEKQEDLKSAVTAYRTVVERYPTDPAAADALYQTGFCCMEIAKGASYDRSAAVQARESFEDFLAQYPTSEKAPQAKENLVALNLQQTGGSLKIAQYYDRQRQYKAAIIYYNDVIRQQPSSPDSDAAKKRLDVLRTKLGDTVFNQATSTTPVNQPAAVGTKVMPGMKGGDGRLQAQSDTSKRPDYVGPQVSAPTPAPVASIPTPAANGAPPPPAPGAQGEPKPPTVPEGDQPALPSQ